ncbi:MULTISPECIES: SprT family protein [unclassified Jeotgalibaca]|uniref:SprT family protein n=1 Tax=unclassified Jeotgalibaca TaxID=2621505 RepID=UPI003FCF6BF6
MNQMMLQQLVEDISLKYFSRPFLHQATFNPRLKTTGGRYLLRSHNLDFNKRVWELYGREELISVIKHELCHYHLHLEGKGYRHRDQDFKQLLAATGGSRYVKDLRSELEKEKLLHYMCSDCGQMIPRKKKINTAKYVCGRCKGKLTLKIM